MTHPYLQAILGAEADEVLKWAVGEDFMEIPMREWPAKIRDRTGLVVADDADAREALRRVKREWEGRQEQPDLEGGTQ